MMNAGKQKYRRLQVENIRLRTVFEIIMLVVAVIVSCIVVINSYEKNYEAAANGTSGDIARQLAHTIAAIADSEVMAVENPEKRNFIISDYSGMLDECFIEKDVRYSGAIYSVGESEVILFAASSAYSESVAAGSLAGYAAEIEKSLKAAASGDSLCIELGDVSVAFEPVRDSESGHVYAVSAAAVDFRASTEFNSPVRSRIVLISVVSGVLILAYFTVSGIRSEKKKLRGEAV